MVFTLLNQLDGVSGSSALPKQGGDQINFLVTRRPFSFKCLKHIERETLSYYDVNRILFSFYIKYGKPQLQIWSMQKLVAVKVYAYFPIKNFTNVRFKGFRGSSRIEVKFTLADLPLAKMDVGIVAILKKKPVVNPEQEPKDFRNPKLGKINKENKNVLYQRREGLVAATKSNNANDLK
ncbi:unnamed protein product [Lactuca saligna]|uniref:Uncharacterized protein n=1 Tax=Lactuca saligna TaxID=75948 RepID=A0AA35Z2S5_LACSI|nr:unnamed protein product [Lactuca saligna]